MTRDKHISKRSYYGEIYLKWIHKYFIIISFSYLSLPLHLLFLSSSLFIFDHLPSAYLFSAQLWGISGTSYSLIWIHLCFMINSLWSPITGLPITNPAAVSLFFLLISATQNLTFLSCLGSFEYCFHSSLRLFVTLLFLIIVDQFWCAPILSHHWSSDAMAILISYWVADPISLWWVSLQTFSHKASFSWLSCYSW